MNIIRSNRLNFKADIGLFLVWFMIIMYVAWFSYVSFRLHEQFLTRGFDFGIFDTIVWNNLHGNFFLTTFVGVRSFLTQHFQIILLPLALVYLIWPDAKALLLAQSLILGLGALPIYWLAKDRINKWVGLVFVMIYLLFPALQGANLAEFHPAPLAAGFLAYAYWYLYRSKFAMFTISCLLAAACQEDVFIIVGMLGLYLFVAKKDLRGLAVGTAGFGGFLLISMVIIPGLGGQSTHFALHRYQTLGHSIPEVLLTLLTRPVFVWQYVMSDPDRVRYLSHLLAPVGYLSLFDPLTLLITLPTVALNLLSDVRTMYALDSFQYSAIVVPFVVISAINGMAWLVRILHDKRGFSPAFLYTVFSLAILIATLGYQFRFGYTPLSPGFRLPVVEARHRTAYQMLELIPPQAVVSAQSDLSPHLTHRSGIYLFPRLSSIEYGPAEYIVLDLIGNVHPLHQPEAYNQLVDELRTSGDYETVFEQDNYLLLQRR